MGSLEEFAQSMADDIIRSLTCKQEPAFYRDQQTFAEELASAVIEAALREVSGNTGGHVDVFQTSTSAEVEVDAGQGESCREYDFFDMDIETDEVKDLQSSRRTRPSHPPLSQSGLPFIGSLDYPDAPPSTPLFPELMKSRHSFARKLKGGLAKEFLPSPPPSTPKDKEAASDDPQVELIEHLMSSLSADDVSRVGPQDGAELEAFAESLSHDIIDGVLRGKRDLHQLAQQLAKSIITSSLHEAKMLL